VVCVKATDLELASKLIYYGVKLLKLLPPLPP
jgi:hypothetical protein